MLAHYLRMATTGNMYGAFRTQNAYAVCHSDRYPLEPKPIVRLMFLVTKNPVQAEIVALLDRMVNWSAAISAAEFQLSEFIDYNMTYVLEKAGFKDSFQTRYKRL